MRHQATVGVHAFLDVGQVAAVDDAVEPLGPADQHTGLAAGQGVGHQLPGRLTAWSAVEQFDISGRMRQQQLDGLRLGGIVRIVDETPETGLPQAGPVVFAEPVEPPRAGFPVQVVPAVVRHHDLLAEPVVAVRSAAFALAAPHPDQGQQRQQCIVQVGT